VRQQSVSHLALRWYSKNDPRILFSLFFFFSPHSDWRDNGFSFICYSWAERSVSRGEISAINELLSPWRHLCLLATISLSYSQVSEFTWATNRATLEPLNSGIRTRLTNNALAFWSQAVWMDLIQLQKLQMWSTSMVVITQYGNKNVLTFNWEGCDVFLFCNYSFLVAN